MPSDTSPADFHLFVRSLENIRVNHDPARVARTASRKRLLSQLEAAVDLLHKHLPPLLPGFQPRDIQFEFLSEETSRQRDGLKIEALNMLVAALNAAKASGLMPLDRVQTSPGWHDYAVKVLWAFMEFVPHASKRAQYRFLTAVVPLLSGERMEEQSASSHFKKRGRSITPLLIGQDPLPAAIVSHFKQRRRNLS